VAILAARTGSPAGPNVDLLGREAAAKVGEVEVEVAVTGQNLLSE
jgi:hypothetical protein